MQPTINLLPDIYQEKFQKKSSFKKYTLRTALVILPAFITFYAFLLKPATPLSPLANAEKPDIVRQSLKDEAKPLSYYISATQKYLDQARSLSQQTASSQTTMDKQKIVSLLNESLRAANNAVRYYPDSPTSYVQRAKVLRALAVIDPSAANQASSDEEIAEALGGDGTAPKINPEDLILYQPIQEASLADNITIALPEEEKTADIEAEESPNANKGTAILKAGQSSITINSDYVTNDNLIYFTPDLDTQNQILSLSSKSKKDKAFTLKISSPLSYDLPITWWIVE